MLCGAMKRSPPQGGAGPFITLVQQSMEQDLREAGLREAAASINCPLSHQLPSSQCQSDRFLAQPTRSPCHVVSQGSSP